MSTSENADNIRKDAEFKSDYSALQRLLAIAGLVVFAVLIAALIITLATNGSKQVLLTILFFLIVIPCVLYAFMLYVKHTVRKK